MKIEKGHQAYMQNLNLNKGKFKNKEDVDVKKQQNNGVNIDISKSTRKLSDKIRENNNEDFDKRVEDIRMAILNDTYSVSSEDIADKIMQQIQLEENGAEDE